MVRKIMTAAVVVGALALGAGCKSKVEQVHDERAELAKQQQKASENVAEIQAEKAEEQSEVAASAREDIAQEREEVAEERQDVAEAQTDLAKDQREESVDSLAAGTLTGTLKSSLGSSLTIRDSAGVEHELDVKDSTRVSYNGQAVELDDYKEGTEVRASFVSEGDDKVAKDVTILNALPK